MIKRSVWELGKTILQQQLRKIVEYPFRIVRTKSSLTFNHGPVRDCLDISLLILSEIKQIIFDTFKKTGFLIISGRIEVN